MLRPLHEQVVFRNLSGGQVNLTTTGKEAFRRQAEQALPYFSRRQQRITRWQSGPDQVEVDIDYSAVAAQDLPNGLKAGEPLHLRGKSVFRFADGQISAIDDLS
ncbi:nuclear transport factor 2 family protein [Hymenobacter persicinus]|uniref:Nuclear transport factor 2 family protein n=2 Tax=Hymenobacter persicinus TaxID=2025506 RepID=A0A4Q5L770_9BACT|nr:nuclear transport factor 2 family protein [Hymenobacter persicinus]